MSDVMWRIRLLQKYPASEYNKPYFHLAFRRCPHICCKISLTSLQGVEICFVHVTQEHVSFWKAANQVSNRPHFRTGKRMKFVMWLMVVEAN